MDLLLIKNLEKLLIDIRGVSIEEVKFYHDINFMLKKAKIMIKGEALKLLKNASRVSTVSPLLKSYLEAHLIKRHVTVIPSLADKEV